MATRSNTGVAKYEKKATPSSNSRSTNNKTTSNAIKGAGTVANKVKATTSSIPSSPSSKSVPSYLRPASSSTKSDSSTPTKKTTNEIYSSQNAARRRSFDRPPSAIRNQKSFVSPDLKDRVIPREKITPTRSSSFSHSSSPKVPASKRVLERNSKSLKPVRSPSSTTVWRKTTSSLKNGSNASSSNSTKSSPKGNVEDTKLKSETKESPIQEANNIENEGDIIQNVEIKEDTDTDSLQAIDNIKGGITIEDHLVNTSNQSSENLDTIDTSSEVVDENREEETNPTHEKEENQEKEESNIGDTHYEDQKTETETLELKGQEENENPNENSVSTQVEGERKTEEETNAASKEAETAVEEGNKTEEKEVQKGQGKRETPTAYNDVIEETKNKLLEKRKNKVKALVGAFETVIDYETAGSNSSK